MYIEFCDWSVYKAHGYKARNEKKKRKKNETKNVKQKTKNKKKRDYFDR